MIKYLNIYIEAGQTKPTLVTYFSNSSDMYYAICDTLPALYDSDGAYMPLSADTIAVCVDDADEAIEDYKKLLEEKHKTLKFAPNADAVERILNDIEETNRYIRNRLMPNLEQLEHLQWLADCAEENDNKLVAKIS